MLQTINLPKGILKVENPDHPFTYDGPDLLLADRSALLAIFQIRETERHSSHKLFSRITNTLIAYPPNTQVLLLADQAVNIPSSILQFGKFYFKDYVELKDLKRAKALMRDKKPQAIVKGIKAIQKTIFNLQSQIQRDNLEYIRKKKQFSKQIITKSPYLNQKATYFDRFLQKEVKVRSNIFIYDNICFAQKKLLNHISDIKDLQPFYEFVFASEFEVDNGVPYVKRLSRKALNLDDIPSIKYDPLKPTRIASLLGWHLINTDNIHEIGNRIPKYYR